MHWKKYLGVCFVILLGMLCEAYLRPLQESRSVRHCGSAEGSHFSLKSKRDGGYIWGDTVMIQLSYL